MDTPDRQNEQFVQLLLEYDAVLQSRIDSIVDLVAQETVLRENVDFLRNSEYHTARAEMRVAPRPAHHTAPHTAADVRAASLTAEGDKKSVFADVKQEMGHLFRKLRRHYAVADGSGTSASSDTSHVTDVDQVLLHSRSALQSLVKTGSVLTAQSTHANLRQIVRSAQTQQGLAMSADVADALQAAQQAHVLLRQHYLTCLASDVEAAGDSVSAKLRSACQHLDTRSTCGTPLVCACRTCLDTWCCEIQRCARVRAATWSTESHATSQRDLRSALGNKLRKEHARKRQLQVRRSRAMLAATEQTLHLWRRRARLAATQLLVLDDVARDAKPTQSDSFDRRVVDALMKLHATSVRRTECRGCTDVIDELGDRVHLAVCLANNLRLCVL